MFKKKLFCVIAFSIWFAAGSSIAGQKSNGPEAYLPESDYTFQPVVEGSEVVHDFILHNRGDAPLAILEIKSG